MNACGARGWGNMSRLGSKFPNLEELYVAENDMRDLPFILDENSKEIHSCTDSGFVEGTNTDDQHSFVTGATICYYYSISYIILTILKNICIFSSSLYIGFLNLRVLDLTGCGIDEWARVQALGRLPRLQELLLDDNPLTRVFAPANTSEQVHFAQLKRLSLSSTK